MSEVTIGLADLAVLPMPPICARSGLPTSKALTIKVTKRPWWAYSLLVLGVLGVALVMLFRHTVVTLHVPHAPGRNLRRCAAAFGALVAGMATFVVGGLALIAPGPLYVALTLIGTGVTAACCYVYRDAVVGGRWVGKDRIRLVRLHPEFARALEVS